MGDPVTRPPKPRFKPQEEWTTAEVAEHQRTGRQPETTEYRAYVREVHEDAGLDVPGEYKADKSLEEMSAEDHYRRISRGRSG
ncbi:MAG: hypothetical protein WD399_08060 [Thermoleophilaceae bacterium]